MDSVTLKYGASQSVTLRVLSIKGMDNPDWIEAFPPIVNTYLDGTKDSQFQAFRRKVRVETDVVTSRDDRLAILYWYLDNNRTISLNGGTDYAFVPQTADGFENEWVMDVSIARKFVFDLDESIVRTTWPV